MAKKSSLKVAIWYIVSVLLLSWAVQAVIFTGMLPAEFISLYMYVPAILAVIFYFLQKDPIEIQIKQITNKITPKSLLFGVTYPFLIALLMIFLSILSGLGQFNADELAGRLQLPFIISYLFTVVAIMPSMFGEEYGWRGYLLPTLTPKLGKIQATLLVGIIWGMWHIPSYYLSYSAAGIGDPIILTILGILVTVALAFPVSYCYYLSKNIIPCMILHGIWDVTITSVLFSSPEVPGMAPATAGLISMPWVYALCVMIAAGTIMAYFFVKEFRKMRG
ncbi:CPBP family intramembrane metalloprotease [Candidatus Micrarchaeota archaeon]|nr:CPBP family intramembrane metalloprotease [Candidatus Micrarchaeota archaeon]